MKASSSQDAGLETGDETEAEPSEDASDEPADLAPIPVLTAWVEPPEDESAPVEETPGVNPWVITLGETVEIVPPPAQESPSSDEPASDPLVSIPKAGAEPAPALMAAASITVVVWGLLYLFTRLGPGEVLDGPRRKQILARLGSHPWSSIAGVCSALGMRRSTANYHLRVLRRHGFIIAKGKSSLQRFSLRGEATVPPVPTSRVVVARQVIDGPKRLSSVMRSLGVELGMSRFGAWKVVQATASAGQVHLIRQGRFVWVHPSCASHDWHVASPSLASSPA